MQRKEFYFPSGSGTDRIHAVSIKPDGEVKGIVQLVHGISEHIGRYEDLMTYFCEDGYACYGHDHLGHGLSSENRKRGDVGSPNGGDLMVEDVRRLSVIAKKETGARLPYVLFGHSMGSLVIRAFLCRHSDLVDAAIVMGTGTMPRLKLLALRAFLKLSMLIHDGSYNSHFLNQAAVNDFNKYFKPNRTPHDWLSTKTEMVDRYAADPLCGFSTSLNTYASLNQLFSIIQDPKRIRDIRPELPMFFVSGGQDAFGGFGKNVSEIVELYRECGCQQVSLKLYPGMRHEIINEIGAEEVYEDLLRYIKGISCSRLEKDGGGSVER